MPVACASINPIIYDNLYLTNKSCNMNLLCQNPIFGYVNGYMKM